MKHTSAQLKQMARANLSNKWGIVIGFTAIHSLMNYVLSLCTSPFQSTTTLGNTVYLIATLIITLLTSLFDIGAYYFYLNICRGREYHISDLFAAFKMNPDRFLIVGLIVNLPTILLQLPILNQGTYRTLSDALHLIIENTGYSMAAMIVSTIFSMFFTLSYFLMLDFPEMEALASMRLSVTLMNGNKWRYVYIFALSFIGWNILGGLSFNIGYLWIKPYITMTLTYFYCDVLEQLKHSDYMREYDVPQFHMPVEDENYTSDATYESADYNTDVVYGSADYNADTTYENADYNADINSQNENNDTNRTDSNDSFN